MKKNIVGRLAVIVVLVVTLAGCNGVQSALVLGYAFRSAENAAMKSPYVQGKITDPAVQMKINALEGEFDTAWNCAFTIYEDAAKDVPEGGEVVIKSENYKPCIQRAWAASFQLLTTVRTFVPTFLTEKTELTTPAGMKLTYSPDKFTSYAVPSNVPLAPTTKVVLK